MRLTAVATRFAVFAAFFVRLAIRYEDLRRHFMLYFVLDNLMLLSGRDKLKLLERIAMGLAPSWLLRAHQNALLGRRQTPI